MTTAQAERIAPDSRAAWRAWLAAHHGRRDGVWLVLPRKGSGLPGVNLEEAIGEALCFGWIDSKPAKLDAQRSLLWFAPRQRGTGWSALNKRRVSALMTEGLMAAPGLARIEAAQADGSWQKLDAVGALEVPPDLALALAAWADAQRYFDAFPPSARRGILEWIVQARRPETRARRVAEAARLAQLNQRANQWKPKPKAQASSAGQQSTE